MAVFLNVLLSGCGEKRERYPAVSAPPTTEVKVAFWGSPEEIDIVTKALEPWRKAHPQIHVRFEHTPYTGYDSKILTRIAGGAAPDVIAAEVNYFVTFATRGVFIDLKPYVDRDPHFELNDFFPAIVDRFTYEGKLYAIPRDVAPFACVFYNKDLFDAAGLPYPKDDWTWDDLLETAKKLTKRGGTGRITQYGIYGWAWQNFIYGNGGALVDNVKAPTKTLLDDPKSVEGLQFYSDLINKHQVMPAPLALANLGMGVDMMFASGRLGMFLSGIWETPALRQKYSFRWDVAMFPKNRNGVRKFGSGGTGYGVLRSSRSPREAWEVVKALTSPEVQGELAERGLAQPARRSVAAGKAWALNPLPPENKKALNGAVEDVVFDPFHPKWREIEAKYILPEFDLLKGGKETAEQAVRNLVPKINEMLQRTE
jgi:ABC-type glycerol-3-phosphate transport system substrate-binding protein